MTTQTALPFEGIDTLERARQQVKDGAEDGIECPCCEQLVRAYRRKFASNIARALLFLAKWRHDHGTDWCHIRTQGPDDVVRANEYSKLAYWGLAESEERSPDEKKGERGKVVGNWRITRLGIDVAMLRRSVSKYVVVLNGKVTDRSEETVYVREALGSHFSYGELMSNGPAS